jgi:hypothetical protein
MAKMTCCEPLAGRRALHPEATAATSVSEQASPKLGMSTTPAMAARAVPSVNFIRVLPIAFFRRRAFNKHFHSEVQPSMLKRSA